MTKGCMLIISIIGIGSSSCSATRASGTLLKMRFCCHRSCRAKLSHGSEREIPDRSAPVGRNPLPSPPPSASPLCLTFHPLLLSPALILPLSSSLLLFLNHLSSLPFFLHSTPYLHASGTAQGWRAASGAHTLP